MHGHMYKEETFMIIVLIILSPIVSVLADEDIGPFEKRGTGYMWHLELVWF